MTTDVYGAWITVLDINPEPWAIGNAFASRKGGQVKGAMSPNEKLRTFKAALADDLMQRGFLLDDNPNQLYRLELVFCREVDSWLTTSGKRKSGNHADTTNLQKATEDALQGVLLHNDRQVVHTTSVIAAQRQGMMNFIAIRLSRIKSSDLDPWYEFCMQMSKIERERLESQKGDNSW